MFQIRSFKFRAYDLEEGCMVEAWEPHPESNGWIEGGTVELGQLASVQGMVVMQFTGLYDCQGREIYEGDVVVSREAGLELEWFSVVYNAGSFCLADYPTHESSQVFYRNWINRFPFQSEKDEQKTGFVIVGHIYEQEALIFPRVAGLVANDPLFS